MVLISRPAPRARIPLPSAESVPSFATSRRSSIALPGHRRQRLQPAIDILGQVRVTPAAFLSKASNVVPSLCDRALDHTPLGPRIANALGERDYLVDDIRVVCHAMALAEINNRVKDVLDNVFHVLAANLVHVRGKGYTAARVEPLPLRVLQTTQGAWCMVAGEAPMGQNSELWPTPPMDSEWWPRSRPPWRALLALFGLGGRNAGSSFGSSLFLA